MRPLVIVRPRPGADLSTAAARALGLEAIAMSLFEIEPLEWAPPDPAAFDALLLTSANAPRHGGPGLERLRRLPAYCVGEATASAAIEAGFDVAGTGSGGVDSLLATIPDDLRLLHLCGADRREPRLAPRAIEAIAVYCARELPVPNGFAELEGAVVALHSPRAAATFCALAERSGLKRESVALVAISEAAARPAGAGWERVEVAPEPSEAAILVLAAELCDKPR